MYQLFSEVENQLLNYLNQSHTHVDESTLNTILQDVIEYLPFIQRTRSSGNIAVFGDSPVFAIVCGKSITWMVKTNATAIPRIVDGKVTVSSGTCVRVNSLDSEIRPKVIKEVNKHLNYWLSVIEELASIHDMFDKDLLEERNRIINQLNTSFGG